MYCPNCGKKNEDSAQVCFACGKSLVSQVSPDQNSQQVYSQAQSVGANPAAENTQTANELPSELNKFNWGAFLLTWIWGIGNGVWLALWIFAFYPIQWIILGIGFAIGAVAGNEIAAVIRVLLVLIGLIFSFGFIVWLGKNGNRLARKTGRWQDVEKFKSFQKKWAIAGLVIALFYSVIIVGMLTLIVIGATKEAKNRADNTRNESNARMVQTYLEQEYSMDHVYCGSAAGEISCGTYSFKDAIGKLNSGAYVLDSCPNTDVQGGGKVIIQASSYTITAYDASCSRAISGGTLRNQ